jgi:hypothetical protein
MRSGIYTPHGILCGRVIRWLFYNRNNQRRSGVSTNTYLKKPTGWIPHTVKNQLFWTVRTDVIGKTAKGSESTENHAEGLILRYISDSMSNRFHNQPLRSRQRSCPWLISALSLTDWISCLFCRSSSPLIQGNCLERRSTIFKKQPMKQQICSISNL